MGLKQVTIKRILREKLQEIEASLPENLRSVFHDNVLVCGGSIASMLLGEKVNDFDLYMKTKESARLLAEHYVNVYRSANESSRDMYVKGFTAENIKGGVEDRLAVFIKSCGVMGSLETEEDKGLSSEKGIKPKEPYQPFFLSDNAITLTGKVQLVVRFFGTQDEIYKNFDFVHCMSSYDYKLNILNVTAETLSSLLAKDLKYGGSLYPIASVFRIRKFLARGWSISAGELLKIIFQLSRLDLTDIDLLRDQLIGVDMTFMRSLVDSLRNYEQTGELTEGYIVELIDSIWNNVEEEHEDE